MGSIDKEALTREAREWMDGGADLNEVMVRLRARGCHLYHCPQIIWSLTGWSSQQIDDFLSKSPVWAHAMESNKTLRKELYEALNDVDWNAELSPDDRQHNR